MSFNVFELPRARSDKLSIVEYLIGRSAKGAAAWLKAYDELLEPVGRNKPAQFRQASEPTISLRFVPELRRLVPAYISIRKPQSADINMTSGQQDQRHGP